MKTYTNAALDDIAHENYNILLGYCRILSDEGYWERPGKLLKEGIDSFLNYYVQSILIYLSDILKRNGETEIKMIASISEEMDYYGVASRKPDSGDIEMALRCVGAPPILMQLFSLRDANNGTSLTGLFFDGLLNIIFSFSMLNGKKEAQTTAFIKRFYEKVKLFAKPANKVGPYIDEKYLFHKICMGDLESCASDLVSCGEDFGIYRREYLFLDAVSQPSSQDVQAKQPDNLKDTAAGELPNAEKGEVKDTDTGEVLSKVKDEELPAENSENNGDASNQEKISFEMLRQEQSRKKLNSLMEELNSLIGLTQVKNEIKSLVNFIEVKKLRIAHKLPVMDMSYHMVFSGSPGTGKTTVARLVSQIYRELGVLSSGSLTETDRSGLVAGYVGQTALKVREVVDKAKGGILFIDEAYALYAPNAAGDFGQEAIDTLVKAMEDNRSDLVVIAAGYTDEMKKFIKSNTGLVSRFNKFIDFPDYTDDELILILQLMAKKAGYILDPDAVFAVNYYVGNMSRQEKKSFGNARGIRNIFERMVSSQADRITGGADIDVNELTYINKDDALVAIKQRIFDTV